MLRCSIAVLVAACVLTACDSSQSSGDTGLPESPSAIEEFESADDRASPSAYVDEDAIRSEIPSSSGANGYWGIKEGEALPIIWSDLMPVGAEEELDQEYAIFYQNLQERYAALENNEDGLAAIEEGSDLDFMPQLGSFDTVDDLDGMLVRIPGYVVPFEFELENRQSAFLFAPYMGACIHTPPPPPNQIIYVEADPAVKIDDIWTAYWLEGTLKAETQKSDLAAAAYTLTLTKIELYSER